MVWVIFFVILPVTAIVGGILYFNIYLRKQIARDAARKSDIDKAYIEAEKTRGDDEDFGSVFGGKVPGNE
jgi:hypothetical protein